MFNLDSQETSAATIPLFLTFFFAEIFVVKEKYSASALQVTVIEYALPSHHPHPSKMPHQLPNFMASSSRKVISCTTSFKRAFANL
jgi:hypothetical protein